MSKTKIFHKVDSVPFLCPLCKGNIQRIIKEDNAINIDSKGEAIDVENLLFDDFFECSVCHTPLNGLVRYDGSYKLINNGCVALNKKKIEEQLSKNPFGK